MKKELITTGIVGIMAGIIMFVGDMFLYFTNAPIHDFEKELVTILGGVAPTRLMIGGLLGPLAAFLYMIGFYQIYLVTKAPYKKIAKIIVLLLSFGIVYGGAFHAHFAHLGFVASQGNERVLQLTQDYMVYHFYIMFFPSLIAYCLLAYLIVTNKTFYPRWFVLSSPIVLFWFSAVVNLLPQPLLIIVAGGWSNIIFICFFGLSTVYLSTFKNSQELGSK